MINDKTKNRFWSKVDIKTENECWEWLRGKDSWGYGVFYFNTKSVGSHRFSWIVKFGDIEEGLSVLHRCDNRKCVNPNHLFLGTQLDNVRDCVSKNRHFVATGEENPSNKVSEHTIIMIRNLYNTNEYSQREIAKMFNLDYRYVNGIILRKTWAHI